MKTATLRNEDQAKKIGQRNGGSKSTQDPSHRKKNGVAIERINTRRDNHLLEGRREIHRNHIDCRLIWKKYIEQTAKNPSQESA